MMLKLAVLAIFLTFHPINGENMAAVFPLLFENIGTSPSQTNLKYYVYYVPVVTIDEALETCKYFGGTLASPETALERDTLLSLITSYNTRNFNTTTSPMLPSYFVGIIFNPRFRLYVTLKNGYPFIGSSYMCQQESRAARIITVSAGMAPSTISKLSYYEEIATGSGMGGSMSSMAQHYAVCEKV